MVGTILLIITEGYDDMAYLSSQVILEEAGNDVISASPDGGALKGKTSSAMTVTIDDAISQGIEYIALVIVGGNKITNNIKLPKIITDFVQSNKIIAVFGTGVDLLDSMNLGENLSNDSQIIHSKNILSMKSPDNCEEFVEKLVTLIN